MHQLLGLNLLFLLSQNRVSEFHTELERLSAKDIQTNVYIRHPVSLEQVPHLHLHYFIQSDNQFNQPGFTTNKEIT